MARPTAPVFRRRLRRLDEAALARFVAALWAGAGWSTAVRGNRVVARRRSPRSERRVIAVVAGPGSLAGTLVKPPGDADLLVAPVGGRAARLLAARTGLAVVDAADLHERLTYGVDDETREHVLAELDLRTTRPQGRRAVLSALAVGVGGVVAGATAPGPQLDRVVTPETYHDRLGPVSAGPEGGETGGRAESADPGDDADESASSQSPSQSPSQSSSCDVGPRSVVHEQVTTLRQVLRTERTSDADPVRLPVEGNSGLTEGFVRAVEAAGLEPFHGARAARATSAERDGDRARVRVRVVTAKSQRVVYVFALTRGDDGCWSITGAWNYSGVDSA